MWSGRFSRNARFTPLGCAEFSCKGGTTLPVFGFHAAHKHASGARCQREASTALFAIRLFGLGDLFSLADENNKVPKTDKRIAKRPEDPAMGVALRTVYQKTVEEAVPDEFLDLLSKLD
jgi:hypothetical protein